MNIRNADINAENSLYEFCKKFGENNEACDFLLKHTEGDNIFIASDTEVKAVFFACDKLVYKNKEGIFIYPVFDGKSPLLDNEIRAILDYIENLYKKDFYIVKTNGFSDSSYSESMGYSPVKHRNFTYEIKKNKEAIYMLFNFEAKPDSIAELERNYRITDDILKFIVVRKEK